MFIMGNFLFMFLLLLERMVTLADLFFAKNVPIGLIIETIVYFMPSFFVMTVPLSCLLSVLIGFSRLSSDSELIAMRAMGASSYNLIKPVAIFGVCTVFIGILMSSYLVEKGTTLAINNLNKIVENISINDLKENEMYENLPGIILFVNKKNSHTDFEGIIAISRYEGTIVTASKGSISPTDTKTLEMNFDDGKITFVSNSGETTSISYDNLLFNMPLALNIAEAINTPMTMGLKELIAASKTDPKAAFELSKRFSLPLSSLIMCLFGFSLGVYLARSGRSFGIVISIGVAFLYNFLMIYIENLAGKGGINPTLGAWLPDIILFTLLLYFLRRAFR